MAQICIMVNAIVPKLGCVHEVWVRWVESDGNGLNWVRTVGVGVDEICSVLSWARVNYSYYFVFFETISWDRNRPPWFPDRIVQRWRLSTRCFCCMLWLIKKCETKMWLHNTTRKFHYPQAYLWQCAVVTPKTNALGWIECGRIGNNDILGTTPPRYK